MKKVAWVLALCVGLSSGAAGEPSGELRVPFYHLELPDKALGRLLAQRERILERDFLNASDRMWVPGTFVHDGESYAVKLRLRGDLPAHWRGDRQSYRVRFKRRLFQGRKEISLIVPWDKHYAVEWLQNRVAEDLGLLVFPGRFVDVSVNGKSAGLYYESEHPTREYLERMGRMPSSIFTFGSNWTFYFDQPFHHIAFEHPGSATSPPVESLAQIKQRRTWDRSDPALARRQLGYLVEFYELVTEGSPDEIGRRVPAFLDLAKFARFVALQNLFGSTHGMALNDNTRLYLDPSSGKLEFIPWDVALWSLAERARQRDVPVGALLTPEDPVFRTILESVPGLRAARDDALRALVRRGDAYRRALTDRHDALLRLYPDEERLRTQRDRHDAVFRENLALLSEALHVAGDAAGPASGG